MSTKALNQSFTVAGCEWWQFPDFVDSRGRLSVADFATAPFKVRRVFFISEVPAGQIRGNHAQKTGKQIMVALSGSILASVDDGRSKQEITLNKGNIGLFIRPKIWCTLSHFSAGAVLAVFASHPYDQTDQIHDYAEFLSAVAANL
jgi:dTDP-4-dehydrorhamnose 3,5-epimerase-like enzyme